MGSDWPSVRIEEIQSGEKGAIAIGPFGSRMKSDCYVDKGVPVIRGTNITGGPSFDGGFVYITEEKASSLGSSNVFKGDLVFPHRGSIGEVGLIRDDNRYVISSSLMKLTCDKNKVLPLYLYYFFKSNEGKYQLLKNASQVGTPGIGQPLSSLKSIEFKCPPLPEQKRISHILGSLDDKIELNRQMNQTLEAMAQALFKSWFVDFDPVIDNALAIGNPIPEPLQQRAELRQELHNSGQAKSLPEYIQKLFPNSFTLTDEMGWVPEGWGVGTMSEIAEKIGMGPFGSRITRDNFTDSGVPVIRGNNLTSGFVDENFVFLTEDKATELSSSNAYQGDIIFTHRGTIGQIGIIPNDCDYPRYVVSQSQMFLRVNRKILSPDYVYMYFLYGSGMDQLLAHTSQVGVPAIARPTSNLKTLSILKPSINIIKEHGQFHNSFSRKIAKNKQHMKELSKLRDTLLPTLISGELRIPEVEEQVKEAVA